MTGPYSGEVKRFDVVELKLPATTADTNGWAGDLDGDGSVENQLGLIVTALTETNDTNRHVQDMLASGSIRSYLELQADSLVDDGSVGATWYASASSAPETTGGRFEGGTFTSNRTATTKHLASADVVLPVFADADPLVVPLVGIELEMSPDSQGGYFAYVRGGIPIAQARTIAYAGVLQMMRNNPTAHLTFARLLDTNKDGDISEPELMSNGVLSGFIVDDVAIGAERVLSAAFWVRLCPEGQCNAGAPVNACADRVKNGNETDVDCGGGTCPSCAAGLRCVMVGDCETAGCDNGTCILPTCSDGKRDGFESDVDCGASCARCATGKKCANNDDCASGSCSASRTCLP
ncbi:MAG: hypothetical protein JNL83_38625 [Myxococcales bacterium]|nr:hypothetical protein [Myxococcales bacterium]